MLKLTSLSLCAVLNAAVLGLSAPTSLDDVPIGLKADEWTGIVQQSGPSALVIAPPPITLLPQAHFTWQMAQRFSYSWLFYDKGSGTYDTQCLYPNHYFVYFDATESYPGANTDIVSYQWDISSLERSWTTARTNSSPLLGKPRSATENENLLATLAAANVNRAGAIIENVTLAQSPGSPPPPVSFDQLGHYLVRLTVRNSRGQTAQTTQKISLRDYLIVSVGDSYASGEGNPDASGAYPEIFQQLDIGFDQLGAQARWRDPKCHRSEINSHSFAAAMMEVQDPHSSVTFLSLACSGVKIASKADPDVQDQLLAVNTLLHTSAPPRNIDALLMSIGGNDLEFASLLGACALPNIQIPGLESLDCTGLIRYFAALLSNGTIAGRYDQVGRYLETTLTNVIETYIVEYPTSLFNSDVDQIIGDLGPIGDELEDANIDTLLECLGGAIETALCHTFGKIFGDCKHLNLLAECDYFAAINNTEAVAIHLTGRKLNATMKAAAARLGWNYVSGIDRAYKRHSYCDLDSWFVDLRESLHKQSDIRGAVHPNRKGHLATASILTNHFYFGSVPEPVQHVKVTINDIEIDDSANATDLASRSTGFGHLDINLNGGRDTAIDWQGKMLDRHFSGPYTFGAHLYPSPAPPRLWPLTNLSLNVSGFLPPYQIDLLDRSLSLPRPIDRAFVYEAASYGVRTNAYQETIDLPYGKVTLRYSIEEAPLIAPDPRPISLPGAQTLMTMELLRNPTRFAIRESDEDKLIISWSAHVMGTYFLEESKDLVHWARRESFPALEVGWRVQFQEIVADRVTNHRFYRLGFER